MQLIVNAGSSSMKWAVFSDERSDDLVLAGQFDGLGPKCVLRFGSRSEPVNVTDHAAAFSYLTEFLTRNEVLRGSSVTTVVHRVVHGGENYHEPVVIDEQVERDIDALSILAPLHNPANLAGIRAARLSFPDAIQVAVFDTGFHHTIPSSAFLYGLPMELYERFHIRKYGFHGISHSFVASLLEDRFGHPADALSCHLGAGSSITAIVDGQSVDTTMGFTPLDGLLMSTRSGGLDPEIPLFLLKEGHYSVEQIEDLLEHRSGLFGLTGHSDLREIKALADQGDLRCRLAVEMLSYRVAFYANALRTAVRTPHAVVFTGGVGEGAWYVRERVCQLIGVPLDPGRNHAATGDERLQVVSPPGAAIEVLVVHADEQLQMHRLALTAVPQQTI